MPCSSLVMLRLSTTLSLSFFAPCFLLLPLLLSLPSSVAARFVNVTVDDAAAGPLSGEQIAYLPDGHWSLGENCPGCWAQPDGSQIHNGTWHDTTYDPTSPNPGKQTPQTASFSFTGASHSGFVSIHLSSGLFTGNAIYVYGVLSESVVLPNSTADITFFIDGRNQTMFSYTPHDQPGNYLYNFLLWHTDSLSYGQHSFSLQNGILGTRVSLILLDYIVYTR